jgi:hypothetical protein
MGEETETGEERREKREEIERETAMWWVSCTAHLLLLVLVVGSAACAPSHSRRQRQVALGQRSWWRRPKRSRECGDVVGDTRHERRVEVGGEGVVDFAQCARQTLVLEQRARHIALERVPQHLQRVRGRRIARKLQHADVRVVRVVDADLDIDLWLLLANERERADRAERGVRAHLIEQHA